MAAVPDSLDSKPAVKVWSEKFLVNFWICSDFEAYKKHVRKGHITFSPREMRTLVEEKPSDDIILAALTLKYQKPWIQIVSWANKKCFDYLENRKSGER